MFHVLLYQAVEKFHCLMCQVHLIVPVDLHHQGISAAKYDIKILGLKSVLVSMLCIGSSISSELMNVGVLQLPVVCTL